MRNAGSSIVRVIRRGPQNALLGMAILSATVALTSLAATSLQAQTGDVELVFASNLDPNNKNDPRSAAQTKAIEAFQQENPTIKIRVLPDPAGTSTMRAIKSRSASPDVMKMIGFGMPESIATGNLAKLDDYIKRDKVETSDWLLPFDGMAVKGSMYSITLDYRIPLLLYRKSVLQRAGVEVPKTWDEVCEAGGKLSKAGVMGYPVGAGGGAGMGGAQAFAEFQFSSMVTEGGGGYFDADGRKMLISEDKFTRAANTLKDLFTKCGAAPLSSLQFGYNEVHDGLRAGTVGMATFGLYRFGAIVQGGAGDDLAWSPAPSYAPKGKQTVYSYQIAMNAQSSHKEEAWKFIKFMTGTRAQEIALEGGEVVARASAYKSGSYLSTPAGQRQKEWAALVQERGFVPVYPVNGTLYSQILGEVMQRMMLRNAPVTDAYKELVTRYNEEITK